MRRLSSARRLRLESLESRCVLATGNPWTMVVLADTQFYAQRQDWTDKYFNAETQWVRDHVSTDNIKFASHTGDVVENGASAAEWQRGDVALDKLDGVVPYGVAAGNHDYDVMNNHASANNYKANFGSARYAGKSWYGGASADQMNHYQVIQAEGRAYLHISMEWQPRATSVAWVQSVIDANPTLPTILSTHSFLDTSGHTNETSGAAYLSGKQIWEQIVRPNPQIFLTLSGHFTGEYSQVATNDENLPVLEMLADYQGYAEGGQGYLRLLKFLPQNNRIDVKSYSPGLNAYYTDANSQFSLSLDFDKRLTFTPLAALVGDNQAGDANPAAGTIALGGSQPFFELQLSDIDGGIRDASVVASSISLWKDGAVQAPSSYSFSYDAAADKLRITPAAGSFGAGAYEIRLSQGAAKITDIKNLTMAPQTIIVQITAGPAPPASQTVTFQENQKGYTGGTDTYVRQGAPTTNFGAAASLTVDNDDGGGNDVQALLRFRDIFGSAAGQIPAGAQVTSARLELSVSNPGNAMQLHRMLRDWSSSNTWNSLGAGVQADGVEALASADATTGAVGAGILAIDVTASVQAWLADPARAYGWVLLPTGSDGVAFSSGQGATPPKLIVSFNAAPPAATAPSAASEPSAGAASGLAESPAAPRAASEVNRPMPYGAGETTLLERLAFAEEVQSAIRPRPGRPEASIDRAVSELFDRDELLAIPANA